MIGSVAIVSTNNDHAVFRNPVTISHEVQLLLAAARAPRPGQSPPHLSSLLRDDLNWERVFQLAKMNHVLPLLRHALDQAGWAHVPPEMRTQIKREWTIGTQRSLLLGSELLRALQLLERETIAAAPIKGPSLAEHVYGGVGLRHFNDIDILIRRESLWRARDVLCANGYRPLLSLTSGEERRYIQRHNDYPLVHATLPVYIELQWEIVGDVFHFPRYIDGWWDRCVTTALMTRTVQTLENEDLLLLLCVHGCKHLWERLGWVCDVSELLRSTPALNWRSVFARARAEGVFRMLLVGLTLAHTLAGAPVPEPIRELAARDATVCALVSLSQTLMFRYEASQELVKKHTPLYYLQMRERFRDKFLIARHFYPSLLQPLQTLRRYRANDTG